MILARRINLFPPRTAAARPPSPAASLAPQPACVTVRVTVVIVRHRRTERGPITNGSNSYGSCSYSKSSSSSNLNMKSEMGTGKKC